MNATIREIIFKNCSFSQRSNGYICIIGQYYKINNTFLLSNEELHCKLQLCPRKERALILTAVLKHHTGMLFFDFSESGSRRIGEGGRGSHCGKHRIVYLIGWVYLREEKDCFYSRNKNMTDSVLLLNDTYKHIM